MKTHVLTFATGAFHSSARLLRSESAQFPIDTFKIFTWTDLPRDFFKNRRILWQSKGFGYWTWKHYLFYNYFMNSADFGDVVFWIDAGCSLQVTPRAILRFEDYIERSKKLGALIFELGHEEVAYSRSDVIDYFLAEKHSLQRVGGIFAFQKSTKTVQLWEEIFACNLNLPELYNDFGQMHHRHDQSVFSILTKKSGFEAIPDETFGEKTLNSPIIASRRKRPNRYWSFVERQLCRLYFHS